MKPELGARQFQYLAFEPLIVMSGTSNNLPRSRYTNEMHAHARSGRAKRAPLLVYNTIMHCGSVILFYAIFFTLRMVQNMMISIDDPMAPKMLIGSTNVANETSEFLPRQT